MHDQLSTTFSALADPTRRAILARLTAGEASVSELATPFDMSLPAISKHLKVLERAGLIVRSREAQWRPCKLTASPLQQIDEWINPYRQFWVQSHDRLEGYLATLQKPKAKATSKAKARASAKTTSKQTVAVNSGDDRKKASARSANPTAKPKRRSTQAKQQNTGKKR